MPYKNKEDRNACSLRSAAKMRKLNPEKFRKRWSDWSKNNKDILKNSKHKTYLKYQNENIERGREYYSENIEAIRERRKVTYLKRRHEFICKALKYRSRELGVEFDITVDWLKQRYDAGVCELTSIAFDMEGKHTANSPSVDRINPNGGYTQDNCRLILWSINRALCNYGQEYMFMLFEKILRKQRPEIFK